MKHDDIEIEESKREEELPEDFEFPEFVPWEEKPWWKYLLVPYWFLESIVFVIAFEFSKEERERRKSRKEFEKEQEDARKRDNRPTLRYPDGWALRMLRCFLEDVLDYGADAIHFCTTDWGRIEVKYSRDGQMLSKAEVRPEAWQHELDIFKNHPEIKTDPYVWFSYPSSDWDHVVQFLIMSQLSGQWLRCQACVKKERETNPEFDPEKLPPCQKCKGFVQLATDEELAALKKIRLVIESDFSFEVGPVSDNPYHPDRARFKIAGWRFNDPANDPTEHLYTR